MSSRRQKMHEAIRAKGLYYQAGTDSDTADVFKVKFKGATAVIEFAGVEVERSEEIDGEKLADQVIFLRKRLEKNSLDRSSFFKFLKTAIECANAKKPSRDGYADLRTIYREFVFELAWSKSAFAKNASSKYFPDFPFYQFLWNLGSFMVEGSRVGDMKIAGRPPAMAEQSTAYRIPNLANPSAPGDVLHVLKIQRAQ
jgi:hypothetical protein